MEFNQFVEWYNNILAHEHIDFADKEKLTQCAVIIETMKNFNTISRIYKWNTKYKQIALDLKDQITNELYGFPTVEDMINEIKNPSPDYSTGYITDDLFYKIKESGKTDIIVSMTSVDKAIDRLFTNDNSVYIYKIFGKNVYKYSEEYEPYSNELKYDTFLEGYYVQASYSVNMADENVKSVIEAKYPYIENNDEFYEVAKRKNYSLFALMKYIRVAKELGYSEKFARRTFNKKVNTIDELKKISKEDYEEETVIFILKEYISNKCK